MKGRQKHSHVLIICWIKNGNGNENKNENEIRSESDENIWWTWMILKYCIVCMCVIDDDIVKLFKRGNTYLKWGKIFTFSYLIKMRACTCNTFGLNQYFIVLFLPFLIHIRGKLPPIVSRRIFTVTSFIPIYGYFSISNHQPSIYSIYISSNSSTSWSAESI